MLRRLILRCWRPPFHDRNVDWRKYLLSNPPLRRLEEQADGSYFIDSNPNLFDHILGYLRRGVLPVFYHNGHDFGMYGALLEEAIFFGIERMEEWLKEQEYLMAVRFEYTAEESRDNIQSLSRTVDSGEEVTFVAYYYHRVGPVYFVQIPPSSWIIESTLRQI
jgi:hypothetical protein